MFNLLIHDFISLSSFHPFSETSVNFINILKHSFYVRTMGKFHQHSASSFCGSRSLNHKKTWLSFLPFWDLGSFSPTYLCTTFTTVAPKSVRIWSSCQYHFMLLGSMRVKAACRMLMKLTHRHHQRGSHLSLAEKSNWKEGT